MCRYRGQDRPLRLIRLLKRDLAAEMSDWVGRQLITIDQARKISDLYGIDYDTAQNRSGAMHVLTLLGMLFIGLALITVIGANWDTIPRGARLSGLVLLTAGSHIAGIWHHLRDRRVWATGLFLFGNISYGASIILIAQIYHLGKHMPDGIFWWALGSLPFGLLLRNSLLVSFSGALALLWFYLEVRTGFVKMTTFVTVFPVFILTGLYLAIRDRVGTLLLLFLYAGSFVWIKALFALIWLDDTSDSIFVAEHFFIGVSLFLVACSLNHWLYSLDSRKTRDYATVLSVWTWRLALLTLLVMSFEHYWEELLEANWNHRVSLWIVAAAAALAALWINVRAGAQLSVGPLILLCGAIMLAVTVLDIEPVYLQVMTNCLLIVVGTWLILQGAVKGISTYFYLGLSTILLTALLRYIDLIGDYVGTAVLFVGFAAILLGAARYWQKRPAREDLP